MKKIFVWAVGIVCLSLVACTSSPDSISSREIVKLANQQLVDQAEKNQYTTITLGYYEENSDEVRYILRQLAANDIITYSCERIQNKKRESYRERYVAGYWWGEPYYDYRTAYRQVNYTAYFVNVELTAKGKKLVVEQPDQPKEPENLLEVEIDATKFPEYNVAYIEFPDTTKAVDLPSEEDIIAAEEGVDVEVDDEPAEEVAEAPQKAPEKTAYELAKEKEVKTEYLCLAFSIEAIKAHNIRLDKQTGKVTADVIYEVAKSTPVGRILKNVYEGQRVQESVELEYLLDKGWVIED